MQKQKIKMATIDLYNNERNEGMRCIGEIVEETKKKFNDLDISSNVYETRFKEDIPGIDSDIFISSGGAVSTPTCGLCLGGHMGVLAEGERAISTTNRNFVGRMGHPKSEIYLANPAIAAASAILGRIANPEEVE